MGDVSTENVQLTTDQSGLRANILGALSAQRATEPRISTQELYVKSIQQIPEVTGALIAEAWDNKLSTALHVGTELATSVAIGAGIGYIVPAKGPAALLVGAAFTVPMVWSAWNRLDQASADLQKPGANPDAIARALARDTVSGTGSFAINIAGGYAGTAIGIGAARSNTVLGTFAQWEQRQVIKVENEALLLTSRLFNRTPKLAPEAAATGVAEATTGAAPALNLNFGFLQPAAGQSWATRVNQFARTKAEKVPAQPITAPEAGLQMYFGSTHGHSRYSDGMGLPVDLYKKAARQGQQVTTITDHNHLAARDGIKKGDPRAKDQKDTPVLAEAPEGYTQTQMDAAATTVPGVHVSLFGIEMGTTGSAGHKHHGHSHGDTPAVAPKGKDVAAGETSAAAAEAPLRPAAGPADAAKIPAGAGEVKAPVDAATAEAKLHDPIDTLRESLRRTEAGKKDTGEVHVTVSGEPVNLIAGENANLMPVNWKQAQIESLVADHLGGVNHINLLEVPTFFEAVRQPRSAINAFFAGLLGKEPHIVKKPEIVKYNDGDYKALVGHLDRIKDSEGKPAIATLNHPRFLADNNPALPVDVRGRDFGRKSFSNDDEWRTRFVKPYVRGIELIKGGALNPNPIDRVPTGMIDLRSYTGYLGLGVEAGPVFGRDFHFGNPVGNPGSTGFLAKTLDRAGILDSMRERRTIATTNAAELNGHMVANDKFPMGSILDQNAVPDIALKMKMGGQIDPDAKYTFKLHADKKVLDGKDAVVIQTKVVTGSELANAGNEVAFKPVRHILGNNSLYFTEITRVDAAGLGSRMFTAPIWVQPLSGAKHGLFARSSAGSVSQVLPLPFLDSTPKRLGP